MLLCLVRCSSMGFVASTAKTLPSKIAWYLIGNLKSTATEIYMIKRTPCCDDRRGPSQHQLHPVQAMDLSVCGKPGQSAGVSASVAWNQTGLLTGRCLFLCVCVFLVVVIESLQASPF